MFQQLSHTGCRWQQRTLPSHVNTEKTKPSPNGWWARAAGPCSCSGDFLSPGMAVSLSWSTTRNKVYFPLSFRVPVTHSAPGGSYFIRKSVIFPYTVLFVASKDKVTLSLPSKGHYFGKCWDIRENVKKIKNFSLLHTFLCAISWVLLFSLANIRDSNLPKTFLNLYSWGDVSWEKESWQKVDAHPFPRK